MQCVLKEGEGYKTIVGFSDFPDSAGGGSSWLSSEKAPTFPFKPAWADKLFAQISLEPLFSSS